VTEAEHRGITGAAITPYLLGRIVELSGGDSLRANIALVKNNAAFGAELAVAYQGR
jgi:pseudouridine-5'-phosphate glycosidase